MKFNFSPTCIGSVPDVNAKEICAQIIANFTEIPFWPQLPKKSFFENMYAQYSEGLPNVKIDENKKSIYLDTSGDLAKGIEGIYEKYLSGDLDYFAITKTRAQGFYEFLNQIRMKKGKDLKFVKGQITGPVSFGLALLDEKKQSIFYNQELQEVLTKLLCMKARWQIKKLKEVHGKIIIFMDEPYMVSIGSSYVNIKPEDAAGRIEEVLAEIHKEGALAGIHCCGNTDWGLLLKTDIDIISFDAYDFIESISLYPDELKGFLNAGKCIAWGIVPTSGDKDKEIDSLIKRLERGFDTLAKKGIDKKSFLDSSLITPSCGCGTLSKAGSDAVLGLTLKIAERMKSK